MAKKKATKSAKAPKKNKFKNYEGGWSAIRLSVLGAENKGIAVYKVYGFRLGLTKVAGRFYWMLGKGKLTIRYDREYKTILSAAKAAWTWLEKNGSSWRKSK